jgi:hypothetical protein
MTYSRHDAMMSFFEGEPSPRRGLLVTAQRLRTQGNEEDAKVLEKADEIMRRETNR